MHIHTRRAILMMCAALLATGSSACSSSSSGGASSSGGSNSDPIKLGAVASLTGPFPFTDPTAAAQAYFDEVNAAGGINGRQIEYGVVDDGADGGRSAQAARQLIDQDGVVALVGSASIPDCAANAQFYARRNVASIPGVGIDAECFNVSNIAPTNTGPATGLGVSLVYAVETLGKTKPCAIVNTLPANAAASETAIERFEEQTGVQLHARIDVAPDVTDFSSYLLQAQRAGCDSLVPQVAGPPLVAMEKQVTALGLRDSITMIELSSAYSPAIAAAVQPGAEGLLANSEFLPFTGTAAEDPGLQDYVRTMEAGDVPLSAFGQGGYVAAVVLVEVLEAMDGEITAESVLAALREMEPVETPLAGNPYVFGAGDSHQPNVSSRFVRLEGTTWQPATDEWTTLETGA